MKTHNRTKTKLQGSDDILTTTRSSSNQCTIIVQAGNSFFQFCDVIVDHRIPPLLIEYIPFYAKRKHLNKIKKKTYKN